MRYIDIERLEPLITTKWLAKARAAYEEIKNLPEIERAEKINSKSAIWTEIKKDLKKLSHGKCWYCESRQVRFDKAIDHYRPKNAVLEAPTHRGYWWLAFDWQNYRYSCEHCNEIRVVQERGGKGAYFPLLDESKRVYDEMGDILQERPVLLDPIKPLDVGLITFQADGTVQSYYREDEQPTFFLRASTSILRYHLNHPDIVEQRQRYVYEKIKGLISKGDGHFSRAVKGDVSAETSCNQIATFLLEMTKEEAEYSMMAKTTILEFADGNRPWVQVLKKIL